jgi:hypothetical protein
VGYEIRGLTDKSLAGVGKGKSLAKLQVADSHWPRRRSLPHPHRLSSHSTINNIKHQVAAGVKC